MYLQHTCLEELVGPMNCSRYMVGTLVKSTLKLTRIHWKLNDLSMAFFQNDWFAVFLSKIGGKMGRKWGKITKGDALESGWIWKCSLYLSSPYKIWEKKCNLNWLCPFIATWKVKTHILLEILCFPYDLT